MDINAALLFFNQILQENQSARIAPKEFERLIDTATLEVINDIIDPLGEKKRGGAYPGSRRLAQKLNVFRKPRYITVDDEGQALYDIPDDVHYIETLHYRWWINKKDCETGSKADRKGVPLFHKVQLISWDKIADRLQSSVRCPSLDFPIAAQQDAKILQVYPTTIGALRMIYISNPPKVKWNFVTNAQGRPIYTATGSVDPLWKDADMNKVLWIALKYVGVQIREDRLFSAMENLKEKA